MNNSKIEKLKKQKEMYFYLENLKSHANEDRYLEFLNNKVYKYFTNMNKIKDHVIEKNMSEPNLESGIFGSGKNLKCVIPKRKTLFDEIVCIHELTHLVNDFISMGNKTSIYNEVIPYFNEYDYLKSINEFYSKQYEILRKNNAIKFSKFINDENKETFLPHIYAYLILQKRKDNYNINSLNRINAKEEDINKVLILKGYTII